MELKNLKIGDKVDKNDFGWINFFKENPRVVSISYEFYDDVSCVSTTVKMYSKDYDEILGEEEEKDE